MIRLTGTSWHRAEERYKERHKAQEPKHYAPGNNEDIRCETSGKEIQLNLKTSAEHKRTCKTKRKEDYT